MEIIFNILAALLGILLYIVFAAKNFIGKPDWSWMKFVNDNAVPLVWSLVAALAIITTLYVVPGSAEAIKTITGIDVTIQQDGAINRVAFLTMGFILSVGIRTGAK